uniref:Uncharacterized protein n=1 Tax=Gossypium raimondii TaxID=29730 RepID=A0A0D2TTC1_GOSRA|nr:hypothetical protein B456_013G021700 [Gossypium raimondii]
MRIIKQMVSRATSGQKNVGLKRPTGQGSGLQPPTKFLRCGILKLACAPFRTLPGNLATQTYLLFLSYRIYGPAKP